MKTETIEQRHNENKNYIKPFLLWQQHWIELLTELNEMHAS